MSLHIPFENTFARLPGPLFARQAPSPVTAPRLLAWNAPLAKELGITGADPEDLELAQVFAGNQIPAGADPLAQVYAGHQFGHFSPQLGDGRAILLGEVLGAQGQHHDIQLKGAGRTPFSRNGDGRAWMGPVLREYLLSEAMHALGVPTTRALAAVATGEKIQRETALPGAVLTRVARSHLRVGHFEFFAARGDVSSLKTLYDHAVERHHPDATDPLDFLNAVIERQAQLVTNWLALGFIHGVMNTDNTSISGETIDYGPCAFMDAYHPDTVFSSIDHGGRYAYGMQPRILPWNMAKLASALLPLMPDPEAAIPAFTKAVEDMVPRIETLWLARFAAKIGIETPIEEDRELIADLLIMMQDAGADFTNTFRALGDGSARDHVLDRDAFDRWSDRWNRRLDAAKDPETLMAQSNPAVIPRNHRVEEMITAAVAGDMTPFHRLSQVLATPYATPENAELTRPPLDHEKVQATFCGT